MGMGRKYALRRIYGLLQRAEEHLQKLAESPSLYDDAHWRHEVNNWIEQMEAVLPHVGKKTSGYWEQVFERMKSHATPPDDAVS
jgi:hypothetical protein